MESAQAREEIRGQRSEDRIEILTSDSGFLFPASGHIPLVMPKSSDPLQTSLLAITQTAVGCGIGLLLAGKLGRPAQKTTGATMISVGALLAVPVIVMAVLRTVNRPTSERGMRRRLDSIRRDSGFPDEVEIL
jgi:hypothetical protein